MRISQRLITLLVPVSILTFTASAAAGFIGNLHNIGTVASTVPGNGDINPYGVAIVPMNGGNLNLGSILVSNFNNSGNAQGTGTTIVEIDPFGRQKTFAEISSGSLPGPCPGGIGLSTALVALRSGFVIVGSLPTTDGSSATAQAGCLIVLDRNGNPVATLSGNGINGPWDMTALDLGNAAVLFVTNVLNDTVAGGGSVVNEGTVLRIVLTMPSDGVPMELGRTVIGSGFAERTDKDALVIGPTGVALALDGTLFVADTLNNRIAAISNAVIRGDSAGTGNTVSEGDALKGPLGLAMAPNGNILAVNANNGKIVEVSPGGVQVAMKAIDVSGQGGGTLFGLAVGLTGIYFVDDGNNTLNLLN